MISIKRPLRLLSQVAIVLFVLTAIGVTITSRIPAKVETIVVYQTEEPKPTEEPVLPQSTAVARTAKPATPKPTESILSKVASHNRDTDCWMVIDNKIYNLTTYFGLHPGGNAELSKYCGKDGSEGFHSKDRAPARDHSETAKKLLPQFEVK